MSKGPTWWSEVYNDLKLQHKTLFQTSIGYINREPRRMPVRRNMGDKEI